MKKCPILYIVVPCYNEEEVLPETTRRLTEKLGHMTEEKIISDSSRIVYVDDGSKDGTWHLIEEYYKENSYVAGIKSSRNRGHQNTLLEGMFTVVDDCDVIVTMDADLQDDIEVLDEFIHAYLHGNDIVYGVRKNRKKDSWFKRNTAHAFYHVMHLLGAEVVYDHADYRLMSQRAVHALMEYGEVNLFLRGIVPMIGFPSTTVEYERNERFAGSSKYPLKKMISFATDGITSLSVKPVRMILALGVMIFLISILVMIYFIIGHLRGMTIPGWASTVVSIWGIGGLQLLAIGVIGEYIGKIYMETKRRPRFIVEEYLKK